MRWHLYIKTIPSWRTYTFMTLVINGLNIELSPIRHEGVNRITKADLLSVGNIVCKVMAILTRPQCLNSSTPSDDAYMRQRTRPSLFHIMICHLIDAKIIMWASAGFLSIRLWEIYCRYSEENNNVLLPQLPFSTIQCWTMQSQFVYLIGVFGQFICCPWHPTGMHLLWMTCWYSGTCL